MGRADRLKEVYEYVRKRFPIHTQSDFAEWLKYNRAYISSAMHGNEKNLTDKLFTNICEAFPGVFDLNYLLTGEGDLLTIEEEVKSTEYENANRQMSTQPSAAGIDTSSAINAAIAAYVKLYEFAESKLADKEQEMADRLADKDAIIAEKQSRIADLERTIADKDAIIRARDARILELERRIAQSNADDLSKYPFSFGAAEDHSRQQQNK